MMRKGPEPYDRDAAARARVRIERRGTRRLAKHLLARNAQWRRTVARTMAAVMAALVAAMLAGQVEVATVAALATQLLAAA